MDKINIIKELLYMISDIFFITNNYYEIPFDKLNNQDIAFIKLVNTDMHDIILHKNLLITKQPWNIKKISKIDFNNRQCINEIILDCDFQKCQQIAETDYNGYSHTYHNININNDYDNYPALLYCIKQSQGNYHGYLPSIGELKYLCENEDDINYALSYANGETLQIKQSIWWSSTEYFYYNAWIMNEGTTYFSSKIHGNWNVMPMFKKLNK